MTRTLILSGGLRARPLVHWARQWSPKKGIDGLIGAFVTTSPLGILSHSLKSPYWQSHAAVITGDFSCIGVHFSRTEVIFSRNRAPIRALGAILRIMAGFSPIRSRAVVDHWKKSLRRDCASVCDCL